MSKLASGKLALVVMTRARTSPPPSLVLRRNLTHFIIISVLRSLKAVPWWFLATVAVKIMLSLVIERLLKASEVKVAKFEIWYLVDRVRSSNNS